ncbi:MAG: hypothetical protein PSX81_00465 [bacterium]|nr:hypothetical protein [bacterium]
MEKILALKWSKYLNSNKLDCWHRYGFKLIHKRSSMKYTKNTLFDLKSIIFFTWTIVSIFKVFNSSISHGWSWYWIIGLFMLNFIILNLLSSEYSKKYSKQNSNDKMY